MFKSKKKQKGSSECQWKKSFSMTDNGIKPRSSDSARTL